MKNLKIYLSLVILTFFLSGQASAQLINDLVVFCNDGHKFILILNGVKCNEQFDSRVKAPNLNLKQYQAKVIFENQQLKDINTTITFNNNGYECVFGLSKVNKKKYEFVYVSSTLIDPNSAVPETKNTSTENTNTGTYSSYNTTPAPTNTTTTPNTNTTVPSNDNSISLNTGILKIGVGENGKINLGTKEGNINLNTQNPSGDISVTEGGQTIKLNKAAKTGCSNPMNTLQFEAVKKEISADTSEEKKLTKAKSALTNCFTTAQVKEIMQMFKQDETKLDFAKHAYEHTNDLNNYNSLKNSFTAEAKKEEFVKFVHSMK